LSALSAAGARVTFVSAASHTVTAAVKPVDLAKVGNVAGVQYVSQIYTPMTAATCPSGSIVSEGNANTQLNAATARGHYAIDGTGVTVGVLSDSFAKRTSPTSAAGDVTTADLPGTGNTCGHTTPVNVADDSVPVGSGPEDEGRAMAQTVHDLAPGANLAFRTAFTGEEEFASNIKALATSGAKVIVDDVTYFDEPMYQDGILSNAVTSVTNSGVSYFSSAANSNVVDGADRNIGSYEATGGYRPTGCPAVFTGSPYTSCHNFSTSGTDNTYGMTVKAGGDVAIDLQWAQPISGVTSDFDMYLLDGAGDLLLDDLGDPVAGFDDNLQSQHPFEVLQWHNPGGATNVQLVIAHFPTASSATPRFKFIDLENGSGGITAVEHNTSVGGDVVGPTIFGHNGAANAGSVAAVPYNDPNTPEDYSSRGPVTLLLGPVNGTTPAAPLSSPQVLAKPDFAATDCVQNTFFGQFFDGNWRFCGTSDAAPHAAGVAALLRSQGVSPTSAEMRTALATTAASVTNGSTASTGAGRLDADAAAGKITSTTVSPSPTAAKPGGSVTITATVKGFGATPTGTVAFADGATSLGPPSAVDGSGHASVTTSTLAVGNRSITATYTPSDSHLGSSGTANVAIDNTLPVASITEPAHLFAATRAITVRYSATDTISGVANYDVQREIAPWNGGFGSGYTTIRSHVTATTQTFTGTLGNEYCFRVIAYDKAGNASAPTSDHCVVVPLDDRSLSTATSGWTRSTSSAAFAGTTTRTTTAGARLSLSNAHVDRIALIVTQCSTCGRVAITLNGVVFKTVNTFGSATHYKVVIIEPPFSLRTTTIGLRALDSGKNLIIDALSVART
jgi:hypothetical protein